MTNNVQDDPLFRSAQAALAFAYGYSPEQYPLTPHAKMIRGPALGTGKGLKGEDGAAQAGMVLAEVATLGEGAGHFLASRFAPHSEPCACGRDCCSGAKWSKAWSDATAAVAWYALGPLSGRMSNYRLRLGIVRRYFGEHINLGALAQRSGVNRDTAADQNGVVTLWLKREESRHMHAIVARLKNTGMIE